MNHKYSVEDRKIVLQKYISLYKNAKEKAEKEGKIFNPNNYKELDIENYSYRFLIKRAIQLDKKESNEYINEIDIKEYFCIENFSINQLADKKEIYILGENGDGKTIALQAILIAMRGLTRDFMLGLKHSSGNIADFSISITDKEKNNYGYNDEIYIGS